MLDHQAAYVPACVRDLCVLCVGGTCLPHCTACVRCEQEVREQCHRQQREEEDKQLAQKARARALHAAAGREGVLSSKP